MVLSMNRWRSKVAIVTGASSGIGAAIADALVENGLIVVGIARRIDRIQQRSQELSSKSGKLYACQADLSKESEILEAFNWISINLGLVHILVNSAGCAKDCLLSEGLTKDFKQVLDINVLALCIFTREALKIMRANDINGHIIHINSILGHSIKHTFRSNLYPASKYAVTALTETLRQELNSMESQIKVTSISPGLVATEMTTFNQNICEEKLMGFKRRPVLKPEDIADGVVYVLSTPEHVQVHELTIKPIGEPC